MYYKYIYFIYILYKYCNLCRFAPISIFLFCLVLEYLKLYFIMAAKHTRVSMPSESRKREYKNNNKKKKQKRLDTYYTSSHFWVCWNFMSTRVCIGRIYIILRWIILMGYILWGYKQIKVELFNAKRLSQSNRNEEKNLYSMTLWLFLPCL